MSPTAEWFRRRVLHWAAVNARPFPWRRSTDAYEILIAELLLHRTRADLVESSYRRLLAAYPAADALAAANPDDVVELLRPLGFSHRARRLPALGKALMDRHGGAVPSNQADLLKLPGVGPYIANAVLAVAFGRRVPLVDPNVIRLVERVFGFRSTRTRPRSDPAVWRFVETLLPRSTPASFGLGLVDLGALVCRRRPRCSECPLSARCRAYTVGEVDAQ